PDRALGPRRSLEPRDRCPALRQPAHSGVSPPQGVRQVRDHLADGAPSRAREPDDILDDPRVRSMIDFDQPLAVLLVGLLHLVAESDDPAAIVARFRAAIPSGSYLAICHISGDHQPPEAVTQWTELFGGMAA